MSKKLALGALAGLVAMAGASAGLMTETVYFTYDDPSGEPLELSYTAGTGAGDGSITFTSPTAIDLVVDATAAGWGVATYSVSLTMNLTVGTASSFGGVFFAPISGTFAFNDGVDDVLFGDITDGAFLTFGTTSSLQANTAQASLSMAVGGAVLAQFGMDPNQLQPMFNVSWALSDISSAPTINGDGYLSSFDANTAFVGSAQILPIPSPGSAALLAIAGLISVPRRRS